MFLIITNTYFENSWYSKALNMGFSTHEIITNSSAGQWKCTVRLWRTVWRLLKKLEIELPYNWGNTHCTHPKETRIERDTYTPVLAAALFTMVGQGDSLDAHRQTDGWAGCGTRTQRCHSAKKTTPSSQFQWGGWNWSLLYTVK